MASVPLSVLIPDPNEPLRMAQGLTGIQGQQQAIALNKALAPGQIQQQQQALQQGQQQLAGGAMENQQKQLALQDQQAMTKALQEWDGKDPNELPGLILRHGGSATAVFGAKNQLLQQQTALTKLQSDQLANQASINDVIAGHFEAIKGATDKESAYQTAVSDLEQKGLMKPGQAPPQYPGDAQLDLLEKNFIGQKALVEQEVKNREAANKKQELDIEQQKIGNTLPGGPLENPEQKYLRLQTAAKTGQPVSDTDKAFVQSYEKNKTMVPAMNFNLQNQGSAGTPGKPSAIAQGLANGDLKWNEVVSARTPQKIKEDLFAEVKALKPDFRTGDAQLEQDVLKKYTSGNVSDQLLAISTAREHMKTFTTLADALDNGNVQLANRIGNEFGLQFGSDKKSNFDIAAQAFGGEVGKAFDGAGVVAGERAAAQKNFNDAMSRGQFKGAIQTVDALLAGKQKAAKDAFAQGRQAQPNFGQQANTGFQLPPNAPSAKGLSDGHKLKDSSGNVVAISKGGEWAAPTQ